MTREVAALLVGVLFVVVIGLMALGWHRRRRRQADLGRLAGIPGGDVLGEPIHREELLHVATTLGGQPLERVAVAGLGFRARGEVGIHEAGVSLDLAGGTAGFIPRAALRGADRATWTIDRVVERDGLVLLAWTLGERDVDSYLRSDDPAALLDALRRVVPETPAAAAELESELP